MKGYVRFVLMIIKEFVERAIYRWKTEFLKQRLKQEKEQADELEERSNDSVDDFERELQLYKQREESTTNGKSSRPHDGRGGKTKLDL